MFPVPSLPEASALLRQTEDGARAGLDTSPGQDPQLEDTRPLAWPRPGSEAGTAAEVEDLEFALAVREDETDPVTIDVVTRGQAEVFKAAIITVISHISERWRSCRG